LPTPPTPPPPPRPGPPPGVDPTPSLASPAQRDTDGVPIQRKRVAQIGERVGPGEVVGFEPGFGLRGYVQPPQVGQHRVVEHGEHETLLWLQGAPPLRAVELRRQNGLELVEGERLVLRCALADRKSVVE